MSNAEPWAADRVLDAAGAAAAIQEALPGLAGTKVRLLGSGWDFDAYEADGRWVFRFPRRDEAQASIHKDLLVLPWIAERVDLPMPRYAWGALRGASFPYVFSGYPKLEGQVAATFEPRCELLTSLGHRLGTFLARLHALEPPPGIIADADLDRSLIDPQALLDHMRRYLEGFAERVPQLADRAARFFDDPGALPARYAGPPRLLHGDLHAEHLLLEAAAPQQIAGILDWSNARVGDPARDFACIYSWGGQAMLAAMLEAYGGGDSALERRARFLGTCFSFMDWSWWVEVGSGIAEGAARRTLDSALP